MGALRRELREVARDPIARLLFALASILAALHFAGVGAC